MDLSSTAGKIVECRAAIAWAVRKPVTVEKVQVDTPKAGEVRVKMVSAGICFSDIAHLIGDIGMVEFPVVLGHEGCGVIESVGSGVTAFKTGDLVIPLWKPECQKCELCLQPGTNLCNKINVLMKGRQSDQSVRMHKDGQPVTQLVGIGCFSEYCVMPEYCVVKVNSSAPGLKLSSFGCCFPTGYGGAVNTAGVTPGSTAVVFGLGSVGLCAVLGCRDAGASRIIGVDTNSDKFEMGKKFGCTDVINPADHAEPIQEVLRKMADDKVDFALVAVGSRPVVESAVSCTRPGSGKTVMIGLLHGKDMTVPVHHFDLLWGKTLTGTWCGGCHCLKEIPQFVENYLSGKLKEVDLLISGEIPLEDINNGFTLLKEGKVLRTIIKF